MPVEKTTFTAPNKLYGDREISGYGRDGLVVHKVGKSGWTISQASSGMQINGRAVYATKAIALEKMDQLLALDIKWHLPWDEMNRAFSVCATDIRAIMS